MRSVFFAFLTHNSQGLDRQGVLHPGHPWLEPLLFVFALFLLPLLCLLLLLLGLGENPPYVCVTKTVRPDRQEDTGLDAALQDSESPAEVLLCIAARLNCIDPRPLQHRPVGVHETGRDGLLKGKDGRPEKG